MKKMYGWKANNRPPTATAIMLEVFENPQNRNDKRLERIL
jgi:hypothetical protein